jgi:hypothetical protein
VARIARESGWGETSVRKAIIAVAAVLVVAAAGGAAWYFTQGTTVEVRVLLAEDGPDVTDDVGVSVAKVLAEGGGEGITGRLVEPYAADPDAGHRYTVEPGAPVRITVTVPGNDGLDETVIPARGDAVVREIVLDAGLVEIDVAADPDLSPNLSVAREGSRPSGFSVLDRGGETIPYFLAPGTYTATATSRPADLPPMAPEPVDRTRIAVEAGARDSLALDVRTADPVFQLTAALPFDETMPRAAMAVRPARSDEVVRSGRATPGGAFETRALKVGAYEVSAELSDRERGIYTAFVEGRARVEVTPETGTVEVPVSFARVSIAFDGALPEDVVLAEMRVIETDSKGYIYGSADVADGRSANVIFMPHPNDPDDATFAASAFSQAGQVLGIAPIGGAKPGTVREATVSLGENRALCVDLYDADMCYAPAE